ncbi:cytochrome P450 [Imleria badia]|nr:cytochrome P450 [Imleria badia]
MQWKVSGLLASVLLRYYVVAGVAAVIVRIAQPSRRPKLSAIPTVGSSGGWLGSWWAGIKYMTNAADVIQEGYEKASFFAHSLFLTFMLLQHNGAPFKIATLYHWVVVVTSRAHIEELQHAREDELSFLAAINEDFNFECLLGSEIYHDTYHVTVMRSQLPRKIGGSYPELRDKIVTSFDEILNLNDNGDMFPVTENGDSLILDDVEWTRIPALTTMQQIICRASHRSFVGLPLCRNPDYVALNIQFTIDAVTGGLAIGFFPKFLRPHSQLLDSLVARFITNVPENIRRGITHLRPIIEERRKYLNEYGKDWTEKPNDFLSWLMDEVPDATVESMTKRMLTVNLAAIHTSANVFTNALYNLAANPQYAQPLREEVKTIVKREGWSKVSLSKMHKVDSFLKESIRIDGIDACWSLYLPVYNAAVKDFMFSDGTLIPKGTRINAGLVALHHDDALYENSKVFDPFRFADMGEEDEEGAKHQFVATSPEYLSFGHGLHACPGRFFAAAELKMMLAHIVTTYDIKLEENTTRPQSLHIGNSIGANPTAKVMFRKRVRYAGVQ